MTVVPTGSSPSDDSTENDPPALEIGEDDPSPFIAERVRVFFVSSLDLGFLLADDAGKAWIQFLRATDDVPGYLRARVAAERASFKSEARSVRERMDDAKAANAKAVWTDAFVSTYVPFIWQGPLQFELQSHAISQDRDLGEVDSSLSGCKFIDVRLKLFPDGTVSHTSRFELAKGFSVSQLVRVFSKLKDECLRNFGEHARTVLWSDPLRTILHDHDLRLVDESRFPIERDLRAQACSHVLTFVERFVAPDGPRSRAQLLASPSLPGLLNRTAWYDHYSAQHIKAIGLKEFGHRDDEIYISHRDSTVIVFDRYWVETDPAGYLYMHDLVLGVEYLASRSASLKFALEYYQLNPEAKRLDQKDADDGLRMVLSGRSLVTTFRESLHFPLLASHGFSRVFLNRLACEMEIHQAVEFIEGRVDNMSVAVDLKSAVEAAKTENQLDTQALHHQRTEVRLQGIGLWVAIVALIVSVVLQIVSLVYTVAIDEPQTKCFVDVGSGVSRASRCPPPVAPNP